MNKIGCLSFFVWGMLSGLFGSDEEGRMSLFVVGCFTPEFQDIFDGDLDGYLLIGNDVDVDGSYLPRNYDNEIPNQNCDLPIRRSKRAGDYNVPRGTVVDALFEVDNTSTAGGGPLNATGTVVVIGYPAGLIPYAATLPCEVGNGQVTCELGTVARFQVTGVAVRFYAAMAGNYELEGSVFSDLFDPDPSNNSSSRSFQVVEPQTRLVYPWVSKNENFASVIVANNYGDSEALVWLSAVRNEGEFHSRVWLIPPRGFLRESTENLFPELGDGGGYSLRLISESPHIRGRWVTYSLAAATGFSPSQGVAINLLDPSLSSKQRAGNELMFGYLPISSTLFSAPVVVNVGGEATDVTLDFYDGAGNLVLSDGQTLAGLEPNRPFAAAANNLVPPGSGDVFLIASSQDQTITGVGFVFNNSGEPSIGNVTGIDSTDNSGNGSRLLLPWVSNNDLFESIVLVNNYGDTPASVQLMGRRKDGNPETVMRNIPANGFLNEFASTLFANLGDGAGYSVLITSNSNTLTGRWVTNNLVTASGRSPSQGVGIHLDEQGSPRFGNDVLFGFLPLSNDFTSAPVVVNVGDAATNVTLRFYDQAGNLVVEDSATLANLEPLRPFATVANNLVPQGSGDVFMVASSDGQPLTGVAFIFNNGAEPAIGNVSSIDFDP